MDSQSASRLERLTEGQRLVFGGDRVAVVDPALAAAFRRAIVS